MTVYLLDGTLRFPDPNKAEQHRPLALGGDLRVDRLAAAYRNGIFPWYGEGEPILWWSPDPRFVLFPHQIKISRSLRKVINRGHFEIRYDTAFQEVIAHCAKAPRPDQPGTWITPEMRRAYIRMFRRGYAHSVEAWRDGRLVGGLYGIAMGPFFFGESMFHTESNASKVALAHLAVRFMDAVLIDCQVYNGFFETMGAVNIPRVVFLDLLKRHIDGPDLWSSTRDA